MQLKWRWPSLPVSVMLRTTTRTHEANHEHFQTLFAVVDPSGFVLHSQVQYRNALFSFTLYPLSLWRIRSPQLQVTHFFFFFVQLHRYWNVLLSAGALTLYHIVPVWWLFIPTVSERNLKLFWLMLLWFPF